MSKDAARQILAESLADIRLWVVVVALAVELTGAGEVMPSLEMLGNGLVQQRTFGVARVVELGLGTPIAHPRADASGLALGVQWQAWGSASMVHFSSAIGNPIHS